MVYSVITFANTHSAILSQKLLKDIISFTIMPTLREISNSCGISIRLSYDDIEIAKDTILQKLEKNMFCFYKVTNQDGKNIIEKL
ncbi:MAG: DUF3343 domain-containing protein [Oscillospiraceae bacterium]